MKQATLYPEIPAHLQAHLQMNISKRRVESATQPSQTSHSRDSDEFGNGGLDDLDLVEATDGDGFVDIEKVPVHHPSNASNGFHRSQKTSTKNAAATKCSGTKQAAVAHGVADDDWEPKRLKNGKWACNHRCKNKQACKHLCCKEGMDKAPSAPKQAKTTGPEAGNSTQRGKRNPNNKHLITGVMTQNKPNPSRGGPNTGLETSRNVEHMDLTGVENHPATQAHQGVDELRTETKRARHETAPVSSRISNKRPRYSYGSGEPLRLSFLHKEDEEEEATHAPITSDNDYSETAEDMASTQAYGSIDNSAYQDDGYTFHDGGDLFADIMAGVAYLNQHPDSQPSKRLSLKAQEQPKVEEPAVPEAVPEEPTPQQPKVPALTSSKSWSPDHPTAPVRPVPERSYTATPPTPSSSGRDSSSIRSQRVSRKTLRALDTTSVRSDSTSSRLRCMNPDPDPISPEEPVALHPGLEDVDPWLIREFASYINFT